MLSALGSILSIAFTWCVGHSDLISKLWTEVTAHLDAYFAHSSPGSQEAVAALEAGISAAATSAITSAQARITAGKFKPGQSVA